ncbi:MAG TPA: PQQ-binding-like beta-propeller repeat protein, partial [Phycisphaerae bacterium]|nr:PQQ-binding-like beta-propeller repeat protein [Phycisphaerae bacterium]
PWSGSRIAMAGAAEAWQTQLPLGYTQKILSYHLVGGNLYAIGVDGEVRAIRADTGEHIWTRPVARAFETIWPPVAASLEGQPAVVFTLVREAVFLDPLTGWELKRVRLTQTSTAAVAVSDQHLFMVGPQGRVHCLALSDNARQWGSGMPGSIQVPAIYRPDGDAVILLDDKGTLASLDSRGEEHFIRSIEATPSGPAAVDANAIYAATTDGILRAIQRDNGDLIWTYAMVERSEGGPVLTQTGLYQATSGGGLYRFDISGMAVLATQPAPADVVLDAAQVTAAVPNRAPTDQAQLAPKPEIEIPQAVRDLPKIDAYQQLRRWYYPQGKKFLAEWPERVVVLRADGLIGLIPRDSVLGEPAELLDLRPVDGTLSNTVNDAVILTSGSGLIRCLRPAGVKQLTPADFGLTTTAQPAASLPAEGQEAAADTTPPTPAARSSTEMLLDDPLRSRRPLAQ